ncbi:hypothetical protein AAT37_26125 [Salmonella enterica]|nr:hypothetical protein [Salmonella enterica]
MLSPESVGNFVSLYCSPQTRDRALRANGRGSRMEPASTLSTYELRPVHDETRENRAKYGEIHPGTVSFVAG